jgi:hypothetical protein
MDCVNGGKGQPMNHYMETEAGSHALGPNGNSGTAKKSTIGLGFILWLCFATVLGLCGLILGAWVRPLSLLLVFNYASVTGLTASYALFLVFLRAGDMEV